MDLSRLNAPQRATVLHGDSPLLVLAGAGTGKTTAVTYRIAHLLQVRQIPKEAILGMTFTNKAAKEMKERTSLLTKLQLRDLNLGTFHSICAQLLRRYGHYLGLTPELVIYDDDDQLSLLKRCLEDLDIDPKIFAPKLFKQRLDGWKNLGLTPSEVNPSRLDPLGERAQRVYQLYTERCLAANAVDFGDLLVHTVSLLKKQDEVRQRCQERWSHILVDEYQDTNPVQNSLLKLLVTAKHSITVVGDDDQSIYRWRGANIEHILNFERDFPGAQIIRLEQNYRSTQHILQAANAVIANNALRKGKTLFTEGAVGEKLEFQIFLKERDEAEYIAKDIQKMLHNQQGSLKANDIAILYRINAQSRPLEDALRRYRLPYVIYGGIKFYDRREIKDALAYLRLLSNPRSNVDFLRIINVPPRGLGKVTLELLLESSKIAELPLLATAELLAFNPSALGVTAALATRARNELQKFCTLFSEIRLGLGLTSPQESAKKPRLTLSEALKELLTQGGYLAHLEKEGSLEAGERLDNLTELLAALDEYAELAEKPSIAGFLEEVALATDADRQDAASEQITLMTLHAAKGLEFKLVYMPGMEEGLFPHSRSLDEQAALEEERRLCYVGLSRAKQTLKLSAVKIRAVFSEPKICELSRFIYEIPKECLRAQMKLPTHLLHEPQHDHNYDECYDDDYRAPVYPARTNPSRTPVPTYGAHYATPSRASTPLRAKSTTKTLAVGAKVFHQSFGEGRVVQVEGENEEQKVKIHFTHLGTKIILAKFVTQI